MAKVPEEHVPAWIDDDIDTDQVRAIVQGGCDSGAYMPAVEYYTARQTMAEHGDDILTYIEDGHGELPPVPKGISWSQISVFYVSTAVEMWAMRMADMLDAGEMFDDGDGAYGKCPECDVEGTEDDDCSDGVSCHPCIKVGALKAKGFDDSSQTEGELTVKCSQCVAMTIQGVATHEHGCPNIKREKRDED